ncbi:tetratricopeptide repeat protein [Runella sp.]|uniref:tetratricopeptide repeat protein n=1 Tax=Runella sp. TaxID=1960881 RepID=UPI00301AB305
MTSFSLTSWGGGNKSLIINELIKLFSYNSFIPTISVDDDSVTIDIEAPNPTLHATDFRKAAALCEKGRYAKAKPLLQRLIQQNPTHSETHRMLGQLLSDGGDQDAALAALITALRWNPANTHALLMAGNSVAQYHRDLPTALRFYDQALRVKPDDYLTAANAGYLLYQDGKTEQAKHYLHKALEIQPNYANALFTMGLVNEREGDFQAAFTHFSGVLKAPKNHETLYQNAIKQAFESADKVIQRAEASALVAQYTHQLTTQGGTEVETAVDADITTAAKIEFAENYQRAVHVVRYKPNYPAVQHLIMHELVHLQFVIEARQAKANQLFTATQQHRAAFAKNLESTRQKLRQQNVADANITNYFNALFDGLNLQAYNTPIDLFIEQLLFDQFPALRPYQFVSIHGLIQEGIRAMTHKNVVTVWPKDILFKSKVYNLINALQFRELYGLDLLKEFQATPAELKTAQELYDEYQQYKNDRQPAEEYELLANWAEDLKLSTHFELVDEIAYRTKRTNLDNLLTSIENDPFDLDSTDPAKAREKEKFQQAHSAADTNPAVMMYMAEALRFFEKIPKEQTQKIAFEIAMLGAQGINPQGQNYRVSAMPNKLFSGYHLLAYYYVSWALSAPEILPELGLHFNKEFEAARKITSSDPPP